MIPARMLSLRECPVWSHASNKNSLVTNEYSFAGLLPRIIKLTFILMK